MSPSGPLTRQIGDLFVKSLDGQLSAEEAAQFEELIASSDEACRCLLDNAMSIADLIFQVRGRDG